MVHIISLVAVEETMQVLVVMVVEVMARQVLLVEMLQTELEAEEEPLWVVVVEMMKVLEEMAVMVSLL